MKINSIPPASMAETYNGKAVQRTQETNKGAVSDRVEFSDEAKSFAAVINEVKGRLDEPTSAEAKHIDDVAKQIENGTYKVDSSKIAEKILGGSIDVTA